MTIRFFKTNEVFGEFSNFSDHPIRIAKDEWKTVEHYFQAMKFTREPQHRELIRTAPTPQEAKTLGNSRAVALDPDWKSRRLNVMHRGVRAKFYQHPKLRSLLLATKHEEIVEAAPNDSFWGVGADGHGMNWLGKTLMKVRDELRAEPFVSRVHHFTLFGGMAPDEERKGDLVDLLLNVPRLFRHGTIPPLAVVNDILRTGGGNAGMSPSAGWEPFALDEAEYQLVVRRIEKINPSENRKRWWFTGEVRRFIVDVELEQCTSFSDWVKQTSAKYGAKR